MARPIQDTLIIIEEDAKRFRANLRQILKDRLSLEKEEKRQKHLKEMEEKYNLVVKVSNGVFY